MHSSSVYLRITFITALFTLLFISTHIKASDHVDGDITINNPVADISDLFAFPSPHKEGHLVLILNSYPFVPTNGHFSDRLTYSFILKPLSITGKGLTAGFTSNKREYRFDCTFSTPHQKEAHTMACSNPYAEDGITVKVDNENGALNTSTRAFAGKRSDPFLFNANWFENIVFNRCIPTEPVKNDLKNLNVLSIVIEFDTKQIIDSADGNIFAVFGEISTKKDGKKIIIDRIGRPEKSNARLVSAVDEDDLRESYNKESTFNIDKENKAKYRKRIIANIEYYDSIDNVKDWQPEWTEALANLLIDDHLTIDISKPFSSQAYFDIEMSLLRSKAHTRSGGRVPGERVINTIMTTMISGGHGSAITDGISAEDIKDKVFPYLEPPNTGILARLKQFLAPKLVVPLSMKKRESYSSCQ
jgi:hypothetical protein